MNNSDYFLKFFFAEISAVCHTFVRKAVSEYFEKHDYAQNCHFWDMLNDSSRYICVDMNPYNDARYVSVSELRPRD